MPPQTKGLSLDLPLICRPGRRPATWGAETENGEGGGGGVALLKQSHNEAPRKTATVELETEPEWRLNRSQREN